MRNALKWLAALTGLVCIVIGLVHVVAGVGAAPGAGDVSATVQSEDHFFGAIFAGYGLAWLWGSQQDRLPVMLFRFLAALMALGGLGRVIAMSTEGRPHALFVGLTVVEFVLPAVVFWLATRTERS
ncbi:MAG TPA: DUF4345 domain-containing protein [Nocardioides sp.]|jgi:hypothetical protein